MTISSKSVFADFSFQNDAPIVCTAIHNGHQLSPDVSANLNIGEAEQYREEDPFTSYFTRICSNRIIARFSRFEVDLNRSRDKAVYLKPEDAWDLKIRKTEPSPIQMENSLKKYDLFYEKTSEMIGKMLQKYDKIFVYDIHSYNHRRSGPHGEPADPQKNPEIILGTSNMPEIFHPIVEQVRDKLLEFNYLNRKLDVRINVKFPGGYFARWLHETFPGKICVVSIEFKKIFMDEWSGELYQDKIELLRQALDSTLPVIRKTFGNQAMPGSSN
ncbi:MAG: N-formylglutamate amidohydrolase [Candidatus Cloacimonetes bacterium]|nr:N-formylglutamate amidohydrolase [Candidatus Cloacimonadota bacterium]